MNRLRLAAFVALLAITASASALAQETRGTIEGVIKDASGAVLPGVSVEARHKSGATATAVTNAEGHYQFPALTPGSYVIVALLSGFSPGQRDDVMLTIGQQLRVDLVLSVGSISEAVNVRAESPIVDVKKTAVTTTITAETIDLIPKGRDFLDAIVGIPGTNDVSRAGGLMIDGATATENRYVVDGMDTTNLQTGLSGKRVIIDFIDQISVQRSGYNAEYRAATGGVVSAISKSGSNAFHGELGMNYSGPGLNRSLQGDVRPSSEHQPDRQPDPRSTSSTPRARDRRVRAGRPDQRSDPPQPDVVLRRRRAEPPGAGEDGDLGRCESWRSDTDIQGHRHQQPVHVLRHRSAQWSAARPVQRQQRPGRPWT